MPIHVVASIDDTTNGLALATWLTAEPSAPSGIANGETFVAGTGEGNTVGLWSGAANGPSVSSGITYTRNIGATNVLWKACTITITAPADVTYVESNPQGSEQLADSTHPAGTYAYYDTNSSTKYTQSEIQAMMINETVDVKIERDGTNSRAKFFSLGTGAVSAPTAQGNISITDTSSAFPLSGIESGVALHFGVYVEGENSSVDSAITNTPNGDFKITVIHHGGSFDN